jgi:hypothetical protein
VPPRRCGASTYACTPLQNQSPGRNSGAAGACAVATGPQRARRAAPAARQRRAYMHYASTQFWPRSVSLPSSLPLPAHRPLLCCSPSYLGVGAPVCSGHRGRTLMSQEGRRPCPRGGPLPPPNARASVRGAGSCHCWLDWPHLGSAACPEPHPRPTHPRSNPHRTAARPTYLPRTREPARHPPQTRGERAPKSPRPPAARPGTIFKPRPHKHAQFLLPPDAAQDTRRASPRHAAGAPLPTRRPPTHHPRRRAPASAGAASAGRAAAGTAAASGRGPGLAASGQAPESPFS